MNPPVVPLLTGNVEHDVDIISIFLSDLVEYLITGEPDVGWSAIGTSLGKTLTSGDTLVNTQNVLGTLINVLKEKGILTT